MISKQRSLSALLLFFGVAATAQPTLAATDADDTTSTSVDGQTKSVEQLAARAATAFRAGEFEAALSDYRRAVRLVTRRQDEATLRMNMGAAPKPVA